MVSPEPRFGPLVHRSVHHGSALWLAGALQFVVAMVVVQLSWTGAHPYSLTQNYISDLGNTGCGDWPSGTTHYVCSPWHLVFDVSSVVLGLLIVLGAFLVRTGFPMRRSSKVGLGLVGIAGLGSIGVGLAPENVNVAVHVGSAGMIFLGGSLALVVLAIAMFRDTRWNGYRAYTLFSGLVGLIALALFQTGRYLGLGAGGMERLVAAPLLLWLILVSVHLLRFPQFAPRTVPSS
jgi:hypothetical membrane protein